MKNYNEDGTKYLFDSGMLKMFVNQMKYDFREQGKKKTQAHIEEELADKLFLTPDAVHSWLHGKTSPSDLEQVKQVAEYFGVDYHQLLKKEEQEMVAKNSEMKISLFNANEMQQQYTKDRVREIYQTVLEAIDLTLDYYYSEKSYSIDEHDNPEYIENTGEAYTNAKRACEKASNLLERNMLDIPEDLFNQIRKYIWSDIYSIIEDTVTTFNPDEDEDITLTQEEISFFEEHIKKFRYDGYRSDLRRIFADFIVK